MTWPLVKVVSGGNTGADIAGLVAAKALNIPTGGYAPKGWRTEDGPKPELGSVYGLVESVSASYVVRTLQNVQQSDGTVVFGDVTSVGTRQTLQNCRVWEKPHVINPTSDQLRAWIVREQIRVLNVAGNRESTRPGIEREVTAVLMRGLQPC